MERAEHETKHGDLLSSGPSSHTPVGLAWPQQEPHRDGSPQEIASYHSPFLWRKGKRQGSGNNSVHFLKDFLHANHQIFLNPSVRA